jgi:hypothetical protein
MEGNARGASLVPADQLAVPLAGFSVPSVGLHRLDG